MIISILKQEVSGLPAMSRPGIEPGRSVEEAEHSRIELFEQLITFRNIYILARDNMYHD
jgi:hypothetical protein